MSLLHFHYKTCTPTFRLSLSGAIWAGQTDMGGELDRCRPAKLGGAQREQVCKTPRGKGEVGKGFRRGPSHKKKEKFFF